MTNHLLQVLNNLMYSPSGTWTHFLCRWGLSFMLQRTVFRLALQLPAKTVDGTVILAACCPLAMQLPKYRSIKNGGIVHLFNRIYSRSIWIELANIIHSTLIDRENSQKTNYKSAVRNDASLWQLQRAPWWCNTYANSTIELDVSRIWRQIAWKIKY